VPFIPTAGELKTKPTQHSVKELLSIGIQPDLLLCRSDRWLPQDLKKKIALFCNMPESNVISMRDMDTIYGVPVALADEGLDTEIVRLLQLNAGERDCNTLRYTEKYFVWHFLLLHTAQCKLILFSCCEKNFLQQHCPNNFLFDSCCK